MRQWEVLAAKKEKNRWRQTVFPDGKKHFVNFFMHMIFAINSFCQRVYPCEGTGARRSSLFSLLTILCFYALLCFCAIFHSGKFRLNLFRSLEKTTVFLRENSVSQFIENVWVEAKFFRIIVRLSGWWTEGSVFIRHLRVGNQPKWQVKGGDQILCQ